MLLGDDVRFELVSIPEPLQALREQKRALAEARLLIVHDITKERTYSWFKATNGSTLIALSAGLGSLSVRPG
jgi:hypothetical protein